VSSPEGVTGEVAYGVAEAGHVLLDDDGHALGGQGAEESAVAVHPPQHWPFGELGGVRPGPVGPHGAGSRLGPLDDLDPPASPLRVGLRSTEMHQEPLRGRDHVLDSQPGELATTHPTGETEEEDDPVPDIDQDGLVELGHRGGDIGGGDRRFLGRGDTERPADAPHGFADDRVDRRVGVPGQLVDLADRRQAAGDHGVRPR